MSNKWISLLVVVVCLSRNKGNEIEVRRCNCYMLGTFETPDQKSLCDVSTGKCSCLKNVVGMNCDKCKDGYFGLYSGKGCTFCRCNMLGSLKQDCDDVSGKCFCKRGYTGHKCEKCINESPIIKGKCCECPEVSSTSKNCDATGKCNCKPHTHGKKCDKCHENFYYDKQSGCTKCGACYDLVEMDAEKHGTILENLKESIVSLNNSALEKEYENFSVSIKNLKSKIMGMKPFVIEVISEDLVVAMEDVLKDFDSVKAELKKVLNKRGKVAEKVNSIQRKFNNTNGLFKSGNKIIKNERKLIEKLNNLVLKAQLINTGLEKRTIKTEQLNKLVEDVKKLQEKTVSLLKANSEDLSEINKEIERIEGFSGKIRTVKKDAVETLENAADLKKKVSGLRTPGDFNLKTSANSDFIRLVKNKVAGLKFPAVNFDLGELKSKLNKVNEYVGYFEDVKRKNSEVVDEFMKIQTHFNMKEIVLKLDEIQKTINKLTQDCRALETTFDTDVKPNLMKIEENFEKLETANVDEIEKLEQDLRAAQTNLDGIIKTHETALETLRRTRVDFETIDSQNPLGEIEEKLEEVETVLGEFSKYAEDLNGLILTYEDYIVFLRGIPLYNDELDDVEREISFLEEYFEQLDFFQRIKIQLENEVGNLEGILQGLPEEKKWLCSAKTIT